MNSNSSGMNNQQANSPSDGKMLMPSSVKTMKPPNALSTGGSGSATGNPRNKTALKPGHSLMDWVRLGNSGVDLTGTGGVMRAVSHSELQQHNKVDDCWLAIRGKVYNVTRYMDFHPGGVEELMRGAGIDATQLFDSVHAWVNYEQLLTKCLIGPLKTTVTLNLSSNNLKKSSITSSLSSLTANSVKSSTNLSPSGSLKGDLPVREGSVSDDGNSSIVNDNNVFKMPNTSSDIKSSNESLQSNSVAEVVPRFDWIQKTANLILIFYTRNLCNPGVHIEQVDERNINIEITLNCVVYHYKFVLSNDVRWPCTTKRSIESGKIEINFTKTESKLWTNFGQYECEKKTDFDNVLDEYDVATRIEITHDSCAIILRPQKQVIQMHPIGYHLSVTATIDDEEVTRSYTPVPSKYVPTDCPATHIPLLVKTYTDGVLSRHITRPMPLATSLSISKTKGNFSLHKIKNHNRIALMVAGSGITPILSILDYLIARINNRMEYIGLMYFNKTENDIWCRDDVEALAKKDERIQLEHILSEPDESWNGATGRISVDIIKTFLNNKSKQFVTYFCVCGPTQFNDICTQLLKDAEFDINCLHCFQG